MIGSTHGKTLLMSVIAQASGITTRTDLTPFPQVACAGHQSRAWNDGNSWSISIAGYSVESLSKLWMEQAAWNGPASRPLASSPLRKGPRIHPTYFA